jgi:murein DD-endopeptidase MepM/ murein hydrolase activator NlpD
VVDIYEGDDLNYADVVLGSTDMWTFLTRGYYLQQILKGDTVLIGQIRADVKQIKDDEEAQRRRVSEISSRQKRLVTQRDQVAGLAEDKHKQLDAIEHDKKLYVETLDELESESRQIESEIRAYQNTPRGRKMYARPFTGGLSMPCNGRITSPFGYRVHPITHVYKLHTGVDISVPTGTPIHAAADGVVVRAQWYGAYGYAVVIDHGGGVQTLYGHNSKLLVAAGAAVKRGQVIALSGATGYATGPHCHFEKRVNGSPVNPL